MLEKEFVIFDFLKKFINERGYSPSIRDICRGCNIASTSTVHSYLNKLEQSDLIERDNFKNRTIRLKSQPPVNSVNIPIVGSVQAGEPIFAEENIEDYFVLPEELAYGGEHFMLKVKGESMINIGIYEDDYVLVKRKNTANNGDIVVALLEDEATIKTYYMEKESIRLQPENDYFEPIYSKDVILVGTVKGVFRVFK